VLDRLTASDFEPAVGETFALDAGETGSLEMTLLEARLHDPDGPAQHPDGTRAPFTVLFRGPAQPLLPQRIYHVEHESVGAMEIFIVPVGQDGSGTTYEAVFG
jgi:hypothetical protein